MRKSMRLRAFGSVAVVGALVLWASPAMADGPRSDEYTCTGGDIPSGTYESVTVTGHCQVPADGTGSIKIFENLNVAAGAFFDAQSSPSKISVGGNVTAAAGSIIGLGCQPNFAHNTGHVCTNEPGGSSIITVEGNVRASGANTVLLNGISVEGNVTLTGGGGPIPWSIKNNHIDGNLKVTGVTADWLGVLFNTIGKNVTLTNITVTDPGDPGRKVFVVRNTIGRNLNCTGLAPGVSGGFFPGEVNTVGRHVTGQCASLV